MTVADRILLSLDAYDCMPSSRGSRIANRVESPVLHNGAADFGTINGAHTVHELSDLLNALQTQVDDMAAARASGAAAWRSNNPIEAAAWENDWNSFLTRWQPVANWTRGRIAQSQAMSKASMSQLANAISSVANPVTALGLGMAAWEGKGPAGPMIAQQPWDIDTDEAAYQHLLQAFKPSDGDPTSLPDLDRRWRASSSAPPAPDYSNTPQPTAPDLDLNAYKGSNAVVKDMERIGAKLPGVPSALGFWDWIVKHKTAILWTTGVTLGGIVLLEVAPFLMLPMKGAKGIAALAA